MVPESFRDSRVCVIGLGYVGLTLATVMAEVGFTVSGVEVREDVVDLLRAGRSHFFEPGLEPRLRRVVDEGHLTVSTAIPRESTSTVYVITVGTPLGGDRRARMGMVQRAAEEVAAVLSEGDLVVMRSTVRLGTTRRVVLPILERTGRRFDLAFCPERTLEGQALEELRWLPQIVGASSHAANVRAAQLFQFVTPTVVRVSDVETAEMIKLVDNAQRDVIFGYANEVAASCDAVGISAREVITAGRLGYPRTNLPLPGPVGGPCLTKDSYILAESLEGTGAEATITMAARRRNEDQPGEIASELRKLTSEIAGFPVDPTIALLGIAFKGRPATDDLRGTMAAPILAALHQQFPDATFRGYDAEVRAEVIREFGVEPADDVEQALAGAHLVLILNNHKVFADMPIEALAEGLARPGFVFDLWNNFDARELRLPAGTGYAALGSRGHSVLPFGGPR